jgi:GMP synthase (glutamine-hydrolysing)
MTSIATPVTHQRFLVVDFGSQYAQLIARRVRELGCYAEIVMPEDLDQRIEGAQGVIFSGSPWSAYDEKAPRVDAAVYGRGTPILGICYGMQLTTHLLGGRVDRAVSREYGPARIEVAGGESPLFAGLGPELDVWMSHSDRVEQLPAGFVAIAHTPSAPYAAVRHESRPIYGVQFHPEVTHTPQGTQILRNFLFGVCGALGDWTMRSFIEEEDPGAGRRERPRRVRAERRGGLHRGGHPHPRGDRRPSDVHLRGQRPAPKGRGPGGARRLPGAL